MDFTAWLKDLPSVVWIGVLVFCVFSIGCWLLAWTYYRDNYENFNKWLFIYASIFEPKEKNNDTIMMLRDHKYRHLNYQRLLDKILKRGWHKSIEAEVLMRQQITELKEMKDSMVNSDNIGV